MFEDVDKIARELPGMTLHGHIPTGTTMDLAARLVELLDENAALRKAAEPRDMREVPESINQITMEAAQCLGLHDHEAQGADIESLGNYLRAAFESGISYRRKGG